jgi:probable HAF family extracellular repeat protein
MVFASTSTHAANFTPLGVLSGGSRAADVSDDGAVVVGSSGLIGGAAPLGAFRWEAGVMTDLGTLPGSANAMARGVSADGSVIVGSNLSSILINGVTYYSSTHGFVWADGSMSPLSELLLPGYKSSAASISADSSVVVGLTSCSCYGSGYHPSATIWTSDDPYPNVLGADSIAHGVAADGSVVVGQGNLSVVSGVVLGEAFRWTMEAGMVGLGDLPGGTGNSVAYQVSADGSVVVGAGNRGSSSPTGEAFRWTIEDGMVGLGDLPGGDLSSVALGVSADGSIVVGHGDGGNGKEAFVWTQEGGMQRLFDVLVAGGATGLDGWTLIGANSISADGIWVVGSGINPFGTEEAFRASIAAVPVPPTVWLLGTGIVGLIRQVRRRRSAI